MKSSSSDDTRIIVAYKSECPMAKDGKHEWKMGSGDAGNMPSLECALCGQLTTQRKLCD